MLEVTELIGFGVGEIPAVLTYIGRTNTNSTPATTKTWTDHDIGPASSDRTVFCVFEAYKGDAGNHVVSSITIGGVSATVHVHAKASTTFTPNVIIASARVPTGTTATIVLTMTVAFCGAVSVFSVTGLGSETPHDTLSVNSTSSGTTLSGSLDIPAGGFAIGGLCHGTNATNTWTGLNEVNDATFTEVSSSILASNASATSVGADLGRTIGIAATSSSDRRALAAASFR